MTTYNKDGQPSRTDSFSDKPWRDRYNGGYGAGRRWPSEIGHPDDVVDAVYTKEIFTDHITPGQTLGFPMFDSLDEAPVPPEGESNAVYITGNGVDTEGLYQWNGSEYRVVNRNFDSVTGVGINPKSVNTESITIGNTFVPPSVPTMADLPTGIDSLDNQVYWVEEKQRYYKFEA